MDKIVNSLKIRERFIEIRKRLALSQKEFGEKLGISGSAIGLIETGKTANPGADVIIAVSSKLDVSLDWLLLGEGEMMRDNHTADSPAHLNLDRPHHLQLYIDALDQDPKLLDAVMKYADDTFGKENPEGWERKKNEAYKKALAELEILSRVYRFRPLSDEKLSYDGRLTERMNMTSKDIRALLKKPAEEGGLRGRRIGNDYLVTERAIRAWFGDERYL